VRVPAFHFGPLIGVIPDLYWINVFGPAYVSHFGKEKLFTVPAGAVEEDGQGRVWLKMAEEPLDMFRDPGMEAKKNAVKRHLGRDVFRNPDRREDSQYDLPRLDDRRSGPWMVCPRGSGRRPRFPASYTSARFARRGSTSRQISRSAARWM